MREGRRKGAGNWREGRDGIERDKRWNGVDFVGSFRPRQGPVACGVRACERVRERVHVQVGVCVCVCVCGKSYLDHN